MDETTLKELLIKVAEGEMTPDEASNRLQVLPYENLDYAKIDLNRELRTGHPEVIFCLGKTAEQIAGIIEKMTETEALILGTKATLEQFSEVKRKISRTALAEKNLILSYFDKAKMIVVSTPEKLGFITPDVFGVNAEINGPHIAVITAGTADIPIAEEAAITIELYGGKVNRIYDVGVAGLHRLLDKLEEIRSADVLIVVAGMEGALASVVGGLVSRPVIAVPTSVGYGASMSGLTALFSMLNSCSLGVSVMNIDNGFGAGNLAMMITEKRTK